MFWLIALQCMYKPEPTFQLKKSSVVLLLRNLILQRNSRRLIHSNRNFPSAVGSTAPWTLISDQLGALPSYPLPPGDLRPRHLHREGLPRAVEHGIRTLNRYRNFWFSTKAVGVTFITTLWRNAGPRLLMTKHGIKHSNIGGGALIFPSQLRNIYIKV